MLQDSPSFCLQQVYVASSGTDATVTTGDGTLFYISDDFLYADIPETPHGYMSFENSGTSCGSHANLVFTTSDSNKCSSQGPFSVDSEGTLVYGTEGGSFQVCGEGQYVSRMRKIALLHIFQILFESRTLR